ncbi:hypothetical protein EVG20_g10019 [Dentipellis fragilis]|uniref:Uncharacterized protein n=1 Tax=Dentipellis fragilis TaxID=205917 RepID=A0A4Y9XW50_9AGAM|nr:hypothetical protein EVG20_g10019 [Dentipellis fragilis]
MSCSDFTAMERHVDIDLTIEDLQNLPSLRRVDIDLTQDHSDKESVMADTVSAPGKSVSRQSSQETINITSDEDAQPVARGANKRPLSPTGERALPSTSRHRLALDEPTSSTRDVPRALVDKSVSPGGVEPCALVAGSGSNEHHAPVGEPALPSIKGKSLSLEVERTGALELTGEVERRTPVDEPAMAGMNISGAIQDESRKKHRGPVDEAGKDEHHALLRDAHGPADESAVDDMDRPSVPLAKCSSPLDGPVSLHKGERLVSLDKPSFSFVVPTALLPANGDLLLKISVEGLRGMVGSATADHQASEKNPIPGSDDEGRDSSQMTAESSSTKGKGKGKGKTRFRALATHQSFTVKMRSAKAKESAHGEGPSNAQYPL